MTYKKRIILLARSRKPGGLCIAGREALSTGVGEWVRPVSARPSGELYAHEIRYEDNSAPAMLDIVDINFSGVKSHAYQSENHTISNQTWSYVRRASWKEACSCLDTFEGTIWDNGYSTRYGINDKIPEEKAAELGESLGLVRVDKLDITVEVEWPEYNGGKRKVRGSFYYNGIYYTLSVSEKGIEDYYFGKADGTYSIGEALLCISLAEPYKGHAYKVIAGVIIAPA